MNHLHAALKELAALAGEKLAGLRRADAAALERCALREAELVKEVLAREAGREALLARLAQSLRCAPGSLAGLSEIAAHLSEPLASTLRARGLALREVATALQQKNRVAAAVAQKLHTHIRGVFATVAKAAQESVVYGAQGRPEASRPRCWMDAVG